MSGDLRPDAQAFDEIRLETVPRFKESELSGDEWRISVVAKFYRSGVLKHEMPIAGKMENAVAHLAFHHANTCDQGIGYFASEDNFCDQEGCSDKFTVMYEKKSDWCRDGHETEVSPNMKTRQFCDRHKRRGDCGLDDSDQNYKKL